VVDLDTALGQQLFDVAVGEAEAQVPADRQHDHVRWEPEAGEGRPWDWTRARTTGSQTCRRRWEGRLDRLGGYLENQQGGRP